MHNVRKENGSPAEILGLFFSYSMPIDASIQEKSSYNPNILQSGSKPAHAVDLKTEQEILCGVFDD